jgi:hypothetical protein
VQHDHDVVAAGGEIRMLDPGSYGLLTITKEISILGGGHGGIAASNNATAITINAGTTDVINLRGLVIEGFGTGAGAIEFQGGASLNVQDSIIRNFTENGIFFSTPTASRLQVSRTVVADIHGNTSPTTIAIQPSGSGSAVVVLDHVELNHGDTGIFANSSSTTGNVKVTISDSVITNYSTQEAVFVQSGNSVIEVMIRNCTISNSLIGIFTVGSHAVVRLTRSTITANVEGLHTEVSGSLISYGDNNIDGNTTNGSPTSTVGYH